MTQSDDDYKDVFNNVSSLKQSLIALGKSNLTDDNIIGILSQMVVVYKPKQSNSNSQWEGR